MWRWWVVGLVAVARAVWVALATTPVVSPDTMRYWNPDDPLMVFRVDLAQGPGQLVQLLYLALPLTVGVVVRRSRRG